MHLPKNKRLRKSLPFIISLLLLITLLSYAPFHEVGEAFKDFNDSYLLLLFGLSLAYYGLKTVRFWYLLQAIGISQPFSRVALSYMSAQPVSLLPGGELYRSTALRKYTGVPVKKSLAQFTMQGVLEGAAMATLAVLSALALHTLRIPMLILFALVLMVIVSISRGYLANISYGFNRLPFVHLQRTSIEKFSQRNQAVLSWQWLPLLYGLSLLVELCGAGIAYIAVLGIGAHIDAYQAVLLYVIPVIVGFISLLPGGIGVSEQSAVGVLLLSHISVGDAVAATIIMRVAIVGLGVLYGLIAEAYGRSQSVVVKNI